MNFNEEITKRAANTNPFLDAWFAASAELAAVYRLPEEMVLTHSGYSCEIENPRIADKLVEVADRMRIDAYDEEDKAYDFTILFDALDRRFVKLLDKHLERLKK